MSDLIDRQTAIDALLDELMEKPERYEDGLDRHDIKAILGALPSVQPESYSEKLKEIADALSEKFAYMNTCLNERDIILGYLGVKRPSKIHCNTDCTNIKCESHRCNKSLPSAQPIYTDEQIQKMQDLESAEIEKAYQLGYEEGKRDRRTARAEDRGK